MLSFTIHMHPYSSLSFIQNIFSICDWPKFGWIVTVGEKGKKTGSQRKKRWPGGGRGKGEVGWGWGGGWVQQSLESCLSCCHSVIPFWCQMSSCWRIRGCCGQYRTLSTSCSYNSRKDFKRWMRLDWRHQCISPGSTLSPPQTTSWPALFCYSEDPTIQPVTNNFFGTMALHYSRVPSKSCKQARAGGKWTIKASGISIWLAECS